MMLFCDFYNSEQFSQLPKEKGRLWYLASPYSKRATDQGGPSDPGLRGAFTEAVSASVELTRRGLTVFSPILHSHIVGVAGKMDLLDGPFWHQVNQPYLEACGGLLVLPTKGYDESEGVALEMKAFVEQAKPIYILTRKGT